MLSYDGRPLWTRWLALQNLILRGHNSTVLTAFEPSSENSMPVRFTPSGSLPLDGRAEEIFERAADLTYDLIADIVAREPVPALQMASRSYFAAASPRKAFCPTGIACRALRFHPHA